MTRTTTTITCILCLFISPTWAQKTGELEAGIDNTDWEIQLAPYFWLTSVDGDTQTGPLQAEVDADFEDVVDEFDVWGAMGRLEARRDRFALFLDGMHVSADTEEMFSGGGPVVVQLDADFELSTVELGASYELLDHRFDDGSGGFSLESLGGGRYTHYEQELDAAGLGPFNIRRGIGGTADWVDPFVGGRARLDLTDNLAIRAYGDVGGFGAADADLSWKARVLLDWRVAENVSLLGGYQAYGFDFEEGSGPGRIGFDGEFHGPIFGLGIRF